MVYSRPTAGHRAACGARSARNRKSSRTIFGTTVIMAQARPRWFSLRTALVPLALLCLVALGACGTSPEPIPEEKPAEQLYNEAMDLLYAKKYEAASAAFDEVERQHPYSVWATRGQLMAAFSYYQYNKYDDAVIAARRFIQLHPGHPDVAYAYYLIGICYYEQISDVGRDQGMTAKAFEAFQEVVRRFPDTPYARDARQKMLFTRDHLAGKEMAVGRYYLGRGYYIAAIGRFRMVVEKYQTTSHVPEALHRLVEAYLALGVVEEAQRAAALLGYNFPESEWYRDSYQLMREVAPQTLRGTASATSDSLSVAE